MDSGLKLCYNITRWQKVSGSHGGVAHLGERLNGIQEVESSILFVSTKIPKPQGFGIFCIKENHAIVAWFSFIQKCPLQNPCRGRFHYSSFCFQ